MLGAGSQPREFGAEDLEIGHRIGPGPGRGVPPGYGGGLGIALFRGERVTEGSDPPVIGEKNRGVRGLATGSNPLDHHGGGGIGMPGEKKGSWLKSG